MKKLLKKKYFIALLVVAVMAIAATGAYAAWTITATSDVQTVETGSGTLAIYGGPINVSGLVPHHAPATELTGSVPNAYDVTYFMVQNTGDIELQLDGALVSGGGDYALLGPQVYVKVTIAPAGSPWNVAGTLSADPGPWPVYQGPIDALYGPNAFLTTSGHEALAAGQAAIWKVVTWLDYDACDNTSMGKSMTCSLQFTGTPTYTP